MKTRLHGTTLVHSFCISCCSSEEIQPGTCKQLSPPHTINSRKDKSAAIDYRLYCHLVTMKNDRYLNTLHFYL